MVAIEQYFPEDTRIIKDTLAYQILPFGMRAYVWLHQPSVVLADEPTASLDTERAFQVVETMANLVHEQGNAGIMVTHDLRLVELTDRVIQMLDGRIERIISSDADLSCLADPATCRMIPTDVLGYEEAAHAELAA
jgi:energy-coupling factor transporter ATP-binding protein EcfA2